MASATAEDTLLDKYTGIKHAKSFFDYDTDMAKFVAGAFFATNVVSFFAAAAFKNQIPGWVSLVVACLFVLAHMLWAVLYAHRAVTPGIYHGDHDLIHASTVSAETTNHPPAEATNHPPLPSSTGHSKLRNGEMRQLMNGQSLRFMKWQFFWMIHCIVPQLLMLGVAPLLDPPCPEGMNYQCSMMCVVWPAWDYTCVATSTNSSSEIALAVTMDQYVFSLKKNVSFAFNTCLSPFLAPLSSLSSN